MKKALLLFTVGFITHGLQAQVGVNTTDPKVTFDITRNVNLGDKAPQGVTFPNFSSDERSRFENTPIGTLIYNTTKKCIEMYQGVVGGVHQWTCLPDAGSQQAQSLAVTPQGFEGTYVGGIAFNGSQKAKFKLENNSFSEVNSVFGDAVSIQNGVANISVTECKYQKLSGGTPTGGEFNCSSGTIKLLSGESALLKYTLSGIPETGTLKADFNKLGAQVDQSIVVGLGSATITNPKVEYIVSLIYTGTTPHTEIQGKLTNGHKVKIPYSGGSGTYNSVTSTTVSTVAGEGGDVNNLSLSIPAGNFGVNGYLEATITVDGDQTYLVEKKAPGEKYEIATIPYSLNGNNYEVKLMGIGGVPDKKFGDGKNDFIYLPYEITTSSGETVTWLNMNLGAVYADTNSPLFNPSINKGVPESLSDMNLVGKNYKAERPGVYGGTFNVVEAPCPIGYRVPTYSDWQKIMPNGLADDLINRVTRDGVYNHYLYDGQEYGWGTDGFVTRSLKMNGWSLMFMTESANTKWGNPHTGAVSNRPISSLTGAVRCVKE